RQSRSRCPATAGQQAQRRGSKRAEQEGIATRDLEKAGNGVREARTGITTFIVGPGRQEVKGFGVFPVVVRLHGSSGRAAERRTSGTRKRRMNLTSAGAEFLLV